MQPCIDANNQEHKSIVVAQCLSRARTISWRGAEIQTSACYPVGGTLAMNTSGHKPSEQAVAVLLFPACSTCRYPIQLNCNTSQRLPIFWRFCTPHALMHLFSLFTYPPNPHDIHRAYMPTSVSLAMYTCMNAF